MATRKRPNRVNPHPARSARRLGGLIGGTSYVGLTIGIVAASASTDAEGTGPNTSEGDGSFSVHAADTVPETLAFSMSGGAEPLSSGPNHVEAELPPVSAAGTGTLEKPYDPVGRSSTTTEPEPHSTTDQGDPPTSRPLPTQTQGPSQGLEPSATSPSPQATTPADESGASAPTPQPTTTLTSSTAEPTESTNAPTTTSVPAPTAQAPSTEPNFAQPAPPEPPIEIESGAS